MRSATSLSSATKGGIRPANAQHPITSTRFPFPLTTKYTKDPHPVRNEMIVDAATHNGARHLNTLLLIQHRRPLPSPGQSSGECIRK